MRKLTSLPPTAFLLTAAVLGAILPGCVRETRRQPPPQLRATDSTGSTAATAAEAPPPLPIANFDDGKMVTLQGGPIGAWHDNEACKTRVSLLEDDATGKEGGRCLKHEFTNVPEPHYSGSYWKVGPKDGEGKWPVLDVSEYTALTFYVKGTTPTFGLELKDVRAEPGGELGVAKTLVRGVTDKWTRVVVPLAKLEGADNIRFSQLAELVVVFSDTKSAMEGMLLIDDVAFEGGTAQ